MVITIKSRVQVDQVVSQKHHDIVILFDLLPARLLVWLFGIGTKQKMTGDDLGKTQRLHIVHGGADQRNIPVGDVKNIDLLFQFFVQIIREIKERHTTG